MTAQPQSRLADPADLWASLDASAVRFADLAAFRTVEGVLTHAEVAHRATAAACALAERGLGPGRHVVLLTPNRSPGQSLLLLGALRTGATVTVATSRASLKQALPADFVVSARGCAAADGGGALAAGDILGQRRGGNRRAAGAR